MTAGTFESGLALDSYRGPATISVDGRVLPVGVTLRGTFQPVRGQYHWYGRVDRDDALAELVGARVGSVVLETPHGRAEGRLSDVDLWGRYRITGTSRPPFAVRHAADTGLPEED